LGKAEAKEGRMKTVWIYIDMDEITADTWLIENDPEGVVFEYEVIE
jgi:hypothetical protein